MEAKQIVDKAELFDMLPAIQEVHQDIKPFWKPLEPLEFLTQFCNNISSAFIFGELDEAGKLNYFFYLIAEPQRATLCFWLAYVKPELKEHTEELFNSIRPVVKEFNYTDFYTVTTRNTNAYKRWASKFGLEIKEVIFGGEI